MDDAQRWPWEPSGTFGNLRGNVPRPPGRSRSIGPPAAESSQVPIPIRGTFPGTFADGTPCALVARAVRCFVESVAAGRFDTAEHWASVAFAVANRFAGRPA